jgi:hypothetical protein
MNIDHTLWVFDTIVGLRDFRNKSLPEVLNMLNLEYLSNCVGVVPGGTDTIVSAVATRVNGALIAPGRFDAVVFLVKDATHSFGPKIGGSGPNSPDVLGRTFLGASGGGLAEVYWDTCFSSKEMAAAIFHEAAHLKSGKGQEMHDQTVGRPHGGPGLRVLRANGASFASPSGDDLDFYSVAITKTIALRTRIP